MLESLAMSLVLTIIIEVPTSIILGLRNKKDIKIAVFVNILTNPIVVFIAYIMQSSDLYNIVVTVLEMLAIIVEFLLFKKYLENYKKSPFVLSLICNALSFGIGLIINKI